jgi:hypothetical protein
VYLEITTIEPEEVTVGSVALSAALWRILCDEADQNVAVLQHEVSILQFDPDHMPVVAMVCAAIKDAVRHSPHSAALH